MKNDQFKPLKWQNLVVILAKYCAKNEGDRSEDRVGMQNTQTIDYYSATRTF